MSIDTITQIARETLYLILKCSMPMLLVSLIVGLIVSVFQTATSIQEQTLTFVPKLIAIFIAILVFGSWILNSIVQFMYVLWGNFAAYVKGVV